LPTPKSVDDGADDDDDDDDVDLHFSESKKGGAAVKAVSTGPAQLKLVGKALPVQATAARRDTIDDEFAD